MIYREVFWNITGLCVEILDALISEVFMTD